MRKLEMNGFILLVLCMVVGLCAANYDAEDIKLTNNYMQIESKFDFEFFVNESNLNELNITDNFLSVIHGSQSLGYEFYKEWSNIAESTETKAVRDASCFQQIAALVAGFGANELASYRYFDSWGKIPAGVLKGHITELGNFDECVDLNKKLADNSQIKGKYCFAKIPLGRALTPSPLGSLLNIDVGVCMPAACSAQEFDVFFKMLMQNLLNINFGANTKVVEEATCSVRDKEPFKARDWVTVSVLIILGIAMLISSLYDYYMKSTGKTPHPFWLSFSVPYNMKQLLLIKPNTKSPNSIPCLNGIRCLSLLWVVIGHTFSLVMTLPVINAVDFLAWGRSWGSQFIQRAFFSVDSFFFLSGFLVAFTVMREMDRTKGKLNVLMMYLHRYLRLTPTLALGVLLYTSLYRHLGNAPIWPAFRSWNDGCLNTWWSTLLYIQNYVNVERMCLPHGWYLAVDMQLYILSPIFLIALWRYRAKGVAFVSIIGLLFVACLFSTMIINDLKLHRKGFALGTGEVMKKIYFVTHVRTSPWLVGLLFGYYMHHTKNSRVKLSKLMVLVGWLATLAIIATLLFCFYPEAKDNLDTTALQEAFYFSLGRVAWPLALSWVVFACVNGYAGPIDGFLSNPIWQPFAKLSYSIYMYHMILVAFNAARTKVNYYFSNYDETLHFWGVFGWSVLLATVLYIAFEAPCANLVTLLLPKRKNTQSTAALSKEKAENIETNLEKTNKNLVEEKQHDVPTDHANNNNIEKSENVEHAENLDEIKSVPS